MLYLTVLLVLALAALVVVLFAVLARPARHHPGLCADCGRPATHELTGKVTDHGYGFSATSETYCRRHAPDGAVKV